jgi:hypothetical protein
VYVPAVVYLFAVSLTSGDGGILWFPTAFVLVSFVIADTIPDLVLIRFRLIVYRFDRAQSHGQYRNVSYETVSGLSVGLGGL